MRIVKEETNSIIGLITETLNQQGFPVKTFSADSAIYLRSEPLHDIGFLDSVFKLVTVTIDATSLRYFRDGTCNLHIDTTSRREVVIPILAFKIKTKDDMVIIQRRNKVLKKAKLSQFVEYREFLKKQS